MSLDIRIGQLRLDREKKKKRCLITNSLFTQDMEKVKAASHADWSRSNSYAAIKAGVQPIHFSEMEIDI